MKRMIPFLTLAAGLVLILAAIGTASAQEGGEGHEGDEFAALRGAALFAEFCQACHGPQGEAVGTGATFAAIGYTPDQEEAARDLILNGRTANVGGGPTMPAYEDVLGEEQVGDLLAYLATWETGEAPALPEPNIHVEVEQVPDYFGDPQAGAIIYAKSCNGCHGPDGEGRGEAQFPAFEFGSETRRLVAEEHNPAFGASAGGPLSEQQLVDLETYLASWEAGETEEESETKGLNVLVVLIGLAAVLVVGVAYMVRTVYTK